MFETARTLSQAVAVSLSVASVIAGCAAPSTLPPPPAADDWQAKVARYGDSNLVNAQYLVSRFCLRGGIYDAYPETLWGPYGFARADALGFRSESKGKVRVRNIATGEDGWWRILFDLGEAEPHGFFINPDLRSASCGEEGLKDFDAQFRPDHRPVVGRSLAEAVYNLRPGTYVEDVSDQPDDVICGLAVSQRYGTWESTGAYPVYVAEAERRGFTPETCAALIRNGSS